MTIGHWALLTGFTHAIEIVGNSFSTVTQAEMFTEQAVILPNIN
jgi:hypothetical protein